MPPASAPEDPRAAPLALWRAAAAFLHVMNALFYGPAELAARAFILRATHRRIASWLRCGEAMLRRLLLIEAAALQAHLDAKQCAALSPSSAGLSVSKAKRTRRVLEFSADQPDHWRVSFRLLDRRRLAGVRARVSRQGAIRFVSTWPLAERYEALIRVFNAPAAYAARLARRLHVEPHRAIEAAPPEARHRIDVFETLAAHAETARRRFDTS